MKTHLQSRWPLIIVVLVMAALACTCGLPFSLGGITDQAQPDELAADVNRAEQDLLADDQGFVMPNMAGTLFKIETGGSIFVPEGALPQGTALNAHNSEDFPPLPEGLQPVGQTLIVTADAQPALPVLLRLPIPAGVDDPDDLVLVRTEANGMATLLATWVDGADLVAYTPGFSQFSIAQFVGNFIKEMRVNFRGGRDLLPGQPKTISVSRWSREHILDAVWTVSGRATLLHQGVTSATIQAGSEEGLVFLSYSAINLTQGLRWYGTHISEIKQPPQGGDNTGITKSFQASVTSENTWLYDDEALSTVVNFHGRFSYPVKWTYSVKNCLEAVSKTSTEPGPTTLPPIKCPAQPKPYAFEITAEDTEGIKTYAVMFFNVTEMPFMVQIEGDRNLQWQTGGVKASYQVIPNDGYNNPLYSYTWRMIPGGDWSVIESRETAFVQEYAFNQPGEHRIEVRTTNGKGDEAKATLPVMVTGADPLDAHILGWPDVIKPNEEVSMTFRAGGGTLLVGGQQGGYKVSIYWGDGTLTEETNVGISQTAYAPVIFDRSHQWAEPGPYTVMLFVEDPTGSIAYAEADIMVEDPMTVYKGVVTNNQGMLITSSDVEIRLSDDLFEATVAFTFEADMKWDDQGVACKAILTRVYSGQAPRGTDLEVTLQLESFSDQFVGSDCSDVSVPAIQEQTLVGNLSADGSFSGNIRNVWFITAYPVAE